MRRPNLYTCISNPSQSHSPVYARAGTYAFVLVKFFVQVQPFAMFALVKYKDNHRAIMPVSLIENFAPKCTSDIPQKVVSAYWCGSDGEEEGYYDANVVLLGGKKSSFLTTNFFCLALLPGHLEPCAP